jgi:hypothetical protein
VERVRVAALLQLHVRDSWCELLVRDVVVTSDLHFSSAENLDNVSIAIYNLTYVANTHATMSLPLLLKNATNSRFRLAALFTTTP